MRLLLVLCTLVIQYSAIYLIVMEVQHRSESLRWKEAFGEAYRCFLRKEVIVPPANALQSQYLEVVKKRWHRFV